jgi:phosphoribosylformylglycinamidine synthase
MSKEFAVVVFPGSNCDKDCFNVARDVLKCDVDYVWHENVFKPGDYGCIMLPGGFSYGDYLRAGAMARYSRAMDSLLEHAEKGGLVIGSCNGFQILLESGMLPGIMMKNSGLKFVCSDIHVKLERDDTPFTLEGKRSGVYRFPIAHNEGNYFIDEEGLKKLEENRQVVLRYCDSSGNITVQSNPNGSINNIAGIVNEKGNVFGLMPHPERCSEEILGNTQGLVIFNSILKHIKNIL